MLRREVTWQEQSEQMVGKTYTSLRHSR